MLVPYLIGAAVGAGFTLLVIFTQFKVKDREWWEKQKREMADAFTHAHKVSAENVKLQVALAAAEMTEDAKKAAAVTMAAFGDGIIGLENVE
jgi:hypothetical protein